MRYAPWLAGLVLLLPGALADAHLMNESDMDELPAPVESVEESVAEPGDWNIVGISLIVFAVVVVVALLVAIGARRR